MCPAAYELVLWRHGQLSEAAAIRVQRHVAECKRCQTVFAHETDLWGQFDERPVPEAITHHFAAGTASGVTPSAIEPGQLWMTRDVPGIVMITEIGEQSDVYRAHPISFETAYISDRDLWLSAADSGLGSSAMVETWLEVPIDSKGLSRFLGSINTDLVDAVRTVANGRELTRHNDRLGPSLRGRKDARYDYQLRELELWQPASERVNRQMTELEEDEEAVEGAPLGHLMGGGYVFDIVATDGSERGTLVCQDYPHSLTGAEALVVQIGGSYGYSLWVKPGDDVPITSGLSEVLARGVQISSGGQEPVHLSRAS